LCHACQRDSRMAQVSARFPQFKLPVKPHIACKPLISSDFMMQPRNGIPEAQRFVSVELKPITKQLTKLKTKKTL
jgi:hypothetical protein